MRKQLIIRSILLLVAIAAGIIGYRAGLSRGDQQLQEMAEEIELLKKSERQANVTRRVSMQMEDIAYQQKEISDKQRLRAEEQSLLALENAERAEEESKLARAAEQRAKTMAEEAELERDRAELQQKEAEQERDRATKAKNVSDTLTYRRLGNTLGISAREQFSTDRDMAGRLTYWSWYFHRNYGGNTYFQESYLALCDATGGREETSLCNAAIHALVCDTQDNSYYAASNYGEILYLKSMSQHGKAIFRDKHYDFRAMERIGDKLYALSLQGPLVTCTTDSRHKVDSLSLPEDKYLGILKTKNETFVLLGHRNLLFVNPRTMVVQKDLKLPRKLSTAMLCDERVCLFYENGDYEEVSLDGQHLTPSIFQNLMAMKIANRQVTAAWYDSQSGIICLGNKNGDLNIYNRWGRFLVLFNNRWGAIRDIRQQKDVVAITFTSKNVELIYLPRVRYTGGTSYEEQKSSPLPISGRKDNGIGAEWLVPVRISLAGWPLTMTSQGGSDHIAVGLANGNILRLNTNVDAMAEMLRRRYAGNNFTLKQWEHFIGTQVPYQTIE